MKKLIKIFNIIMDIFDPVPIPAPKGEAYCTKKGMRKKVFINATMILVGLIGYFVIHYLFVDVLDMPTSTRDLEASSPSFKFFNNGTYTLSYVEWAIFLITFLTISLTPFLRYIPFATVFFDVLYCISVGYNTSFMYWSVAQSDSRIAIITLVLSVILCAIPYILFKYGNIKLPKSFSNVVTVLFWIIIMGSTVCRILCYIPVIDWIATFFYNLYNTPIAGEVLIVGRVVVYLLYIFLWLDRIIEFVRKKA